MSTIRMEAVGQENLDRAQKLLAGIEGGMDKAVKNALSRAVSHLRSHSAQAVRERYAISAANIRASENVTIRYTYQNGVQAFVNFHGDKIPLYRYDGSAPAQPTPDTGHWVRVLTAKGWRNVHPGVPASGHQLKGTSPTRFSGAFVARMGSHIGIFERTGGATASGRDEVRELMGSSVPQMLGSPEVAEKLAKDSMEKFEERLDHEVLRILSGWGG